MKNRLFLIALLINASIYSQVKSNPNNVWAAKEYNKDVALFYSKNFLYSKILGVNENIVKFEVIPLASAFSGELTTLIYNCDSKQKEGLILGFYGNYWNDAGVLYTGYDFKNLDKSQAVEFLNKIQKALDENYKYLKEDNDNNNIYFKYDDIEVLIYTTSQTSIIRLIWNGFDSTWEKTAFDRSKRRFEKRIK